MNYKISALKAFTDNYIWVIDNGKQAVVVDPGDSEPVLEFLSTQNLDLSAILLTHSHADHAGGVTKLNLSYAPLVIDNFKAQLSEGEKISISGFPDFEVITTPGHVFEHVCFLLDNKHLFCGDTLFSLGCGRVFSGDYHAMYESLAKIKQLGQVNDSSDSGIYCYPAHEYTLRNLEFTLSVDTDTEYYRFYQTDINLRLTKFGRSLPCLLSDELRYNLFLRSSERRLWDLIANKVNQPIQSELEYFIELRLLRNNF